MRSDAHARAGARPISKRRRGAGEGLSSRRTLLHAAHPATHPRTPGGGGRSTPSAAAPCQRPRQACVSRCVMSSWRGLRAASRLGQIIVRLRGRVLQPTCERTRAVRTQDLSKLDASKLTPLSPEVISRQATINIGAPPLRSARARAKAAAATASAASSVRPGAAITAWPRGRSSPSGTAQEQERGAQVESSTQQQQQQHPPGRALSACSE